MDNSTVTELQFTAYFQDQHMPRKESEILSGNSNPTL